MSLELPSGIEARISVLKTLLTDEDYRERLHPIERLIAQSVVEEWRHLKCGGCLKWINALIDKMSAIEDTSNRPTTLVMNDDVGEEDEDSSGT